MKNMALDRIFCPLCLKYPLIDYGQGLLCRLCNYSINSKEDYLQLSRRLKKEIKDHSLNCKQKAKIIYVNEYIVHGVCFICNSCYRVFSMELNK